MSDRSSPPFRADHVGSLLRPQRLLQARSKHADGVLSDDELRAVEDDAIRDVVRMQEDVGLRAATDGEFRRTSWHMDFIYQLGGVSKTSEKLAVHFFNESGTLDFEAPAFLPRRWSTARPALSYGGQASLSLPAEWAFQRDPKPPCLFHFRFWYAEVPEAGDSAFVAPGELVFGIGSVPGNVDA